MVTVQRGKGKRMRGEKMRARMFQSLAPVWEAGKKLV